MVMRDEDDFFLFSRYTLNELIKLILTDAHIPIDLNKLIFLLNDISRHDYLSSYFTNEPFILKVV